MLARDKRTLLPPTLLETTIALNEKKHGRPNIVHPIVRKALESAKMSPVISVKLEYSIHLCPPSMLSELKLIFPEVVKILETMKEETNDNQDCNLMIVPTFQPCKNDMVGVSFEINKERDEKLAAFYAWAVSICTLVRNHGFWADLTDPASGYPVLGPSGSSFYPDVPGAQKLLGYELSHTGCCTLISHPSWRTRCYPATLFAFCPVSILKKCIALSIESPK